MLSVRIPAPMDHLGASPREKYCKNSDFFDEQITQQSEYYRDERASMIQKSKESKEGMQADTWNDEMQCLGAENSFPHADPMQVVQNSEFETATMETCMEEQIPEHVLVTTITTTTTHTKGITTSTFTSTSTSTFTSTTHFTANTNTTSTTTPDTNANAFKKAYPLPTEPNTKALGCTTNKDLTVKPHLALKSGPTTHFYPNTNAIPITKSIPASSINALPPRMSTFFPFARPSPSGPSNRETVPRPPRGALPVPNRRRSYACIIVGKDRTAQQS